MAKCKKKYLREIVAYRGQFGIAATAEKYGIKPSTVKRRYREARNRGLLADDRNEVPKILWFDIETSLMLAFGFSTGKQYVGWKDVKVPWHMLSWSAKWLCDTEIIGHKITGEQALERNDRDIVEFLWELIDEADIIVGHNIKGFDEGKMNTRFLNFDMPPPSPYQMIDTYRVVRKNFKMISNSLDYAGRFMVDDQKDPTKKRLWKRCFGGDEEALEYMLTYNKQDVRLLEEVFFKIRPWMKGTPNVAAYYTDNAARCSKCGSKDLTITDDYYYTTANRYKAARCKCGAVMRTPFGELSKEERSTLMRPIAR